MYDDALPLFAKRTSSKIKNSASGPNERGVRDTGRFEISLRFFGNTAWVAIVRLASDRIDDGANQAQRRFGVENIDPRGRRDPE